MSQSPYRARFDLDRFRKRFRASLTARLSLRLHMAIIVALVFASSMVTSRVLFKLGVGSMPLRYFTAVLAGYAAFFGLVRLWLLTLAGRLEDDAPPSHGPEEVAAAMVPLAVAAEDRRAGASESPGDVNIGDLPSPNVGGSSGGSGGSGASGAADALGGVDGDAVVVLIIVIIAAIALAIFGVAAYFVWEAPAILGEAAFDLVLASVLARSSRRIDGPGWGGSVFRATWVPCLIVLVIATGGGWAAQVLCPGALTMPSVVKQCVQSKDAGKHR